VFYLYPIITVFVTSFCKWDYTNITSPEFFGWNDLWNNYNYIFNKYPFFWEALKNSTKWAIVGAIVQIPIATLIALSLSRKVKGIKFVRIVYIIPNMISTAAMGVIFLQLYNPSYGIINPIIRLFNKDFSDSILLLKGPAFVAMTCAYIFFTGSQRVGKIVKCEKHPKADKLLVSQIKLGSEMRQIVSGIAEWYKPEEMVDKNVIVVCNLKPVNLRGVESQGMILAAGDDGDDLVIPEAIGAKDGAEVR